MVDAATESWGVKVTRIEIKDIAPPRDLVDSMARQMKAEREKRAQILEAEGLRQAAILKAEGEKQAVVLAAEGRKEAAFRDAEARERFAQAEAKATEVVSEAIAKGNVQAINYFVANNYVKALEAIAKSPNQKVLMMPLEASAVIGSLAGLAEITSEAFGRNGAGRHAGTSAGRGARQGSVPHGLSQAAAGRTDTMQGLVAYFYGFGAWNWLILAVLLFILETVVPGVHFLWFGIAAVIVGALAMATGIAWPLQFIAFAVISVLTVFWVRRYVRPDVATSDLPDLNVRGQQYIGRSLVVEQAIQNGRGKVRVDDTLWLAEGPDAPAGARVTVTATKGNVLVVERAAT